MTNKPEKVPFNQVFLNKHTYELFKEGNFFTKCVLDGVTAERKPVVLIFSNFEALMQLWNPKMVKYEGLIFTTRELEEIAVQDNHGKIMLALKMDFRALLIEDEIKYNLVKFNTGIDDIPEFYKKMSIEDKIKIVKTQLKEFGKEYKIPGPSAAKKRSRK